MGRGEWDSASTYSNACAPAGSDRHEASALRAEELLGPLPSLGPLETWPPSEQLLAHVRREDVDSETPHLITILHHLGLVLWVNVVPPSVRRILRALRRQTFR